MGRQKVAVPEGKTRVKDEKKHYDVLPTPKNERLYINATLNDLFEDNKDQRFQFEKSRDK